MNKFLNEQEVFGSFGTTNVAAIVNLLDGQYTRDNGLLDLTEGATADGMGVVLDEKVVGKIRGQLEINSKRNPGCGNKTLVFSSTNRKYGLALGKVVDREAIVYRSDGLFVSDDGVKGSLANAEIVVAGKNNNGLYQWLCLPQSLMNGGDVSYIKKTYCKYRGLFPDRDVKIFAGKNLSLNYAPIGDNVMIDVRFM